MGGAENKDGVAEHKGGGAVLQWPLSLVALALHMKSGGSLFII